MDINHTGITRFQAEDIRITGEDIDKCVDRHLLYSWKLKLDSQNVKTKNYLDFLKTQMLDDDFKLDEITYQKAKGYQRVIGYLSCKIQNKISELKTVEKETKRIDTSQAFISAAKRILPPQTFMEIVNASKDNNGNFIL